MAKTVKLVTLEGIQTWEWRTTEVELTDELIKEIKEEHDGDVLDWMLENDLQDEMDLVRDKVNQTDFDVFFEEDGERLEIDGLITD